MPKDDWAKARAKDIGKRVIAKSAASDEYRAFGIETVRTATKQKKTDLPDGYERCRYCKTPVRTKKMRRHVAKRCPKRPDAAG